MQTPLHFACLNGHKSVRIFKLVFNVRQTQETFQYSIIYLSNKTVLQYYDINTKKKNIP